MEQLLLPPLKELAELAIDGYFLYGQEGYWRHVRSNWRSRTLGFMIQRAKRNPDFRQGQLRCIVPEEQQDDFLLYSQYLMRRSVERGQEEMVSQKTARKQQSEMSVAKTVEQTRPAPTQKEPQSPVSVTASLYRERYL